MGGMGLKVFLLFFGRILQVIGVVNDRVIIGLC